MAGAGKLDRRITIQRRTKVTNDYNEKESVWPALTTVWASRHDVSDREQLSADQENASLTSRFKIRSSVTTRSVTPADRVSYDGAIWEISGVKETTEGRNRYLWITATREAD